MKKNVLILILILFDNAHAYEGFVRFGVRHFTLNGKGLGKKAAAE